MSCSNESEESASCSNIPPSPIPPWHRANTSPGTQTLTLAGEIDLSKFTTFLNSNSASPIALTLGNGTYLQQRKSLMVPKSRLDDGDSATWTIAGAFSGFTSLKIDKVGYNAELQWDGTGWQLIGGNATTEPELE